MGAFLLVCAGLIALVALCLASYDAGWKASEREREKIHYLRGQ